MEISAFVRNTHNERYTQRYKHTNKTKNMND